MSGKKIHFEKDSDILSYLKRIARNLSIDNFKNNRRTLGIEEFLEEGEDPYPEIDLINDFEFLLNELNQKQITVVLMRVKGYRFSEIAEKMNMSTDAVKKIFYRCRNKLKILLE